MNVSKGMRKQMARITARGLNPDERRLVTSGKQAVAPEQLVTIEEQHRKEHRTRMQWWARGQRRNT